MKKVLLIVIAIVMIFAMAACGAKEPAAPEVEEDPTMNQPAADPNEDPTMNQPAEPGEGPLGPVMPMLPAEGEEETPAVDAEPAPAPEGAPAEMSLDEIMAAILDGVETPASETMALDAESVQYFAFVPMPEGGEALVSEGMISAIAHSVVLVRTADAADAEKVAAEIEKNADPRKWVCVEAEKKVVAVHDNTILLVMSNAAAADGIIANFDALYA
ncbi:MAG: hypothetical protein IKK29_07560 [Christensenellaceae bacterium]|nr:hypothetical protein [Christensenellaceae bacterium]